MYDFTIIKSIQGPATNNGDLLGITEAANGIVLSNVPVNSVVMDHFIIYYFINIILFYFIYYQYYLLLHFMIFLVLIVMVLLLVMNYQKVI